jgi:hypothetical protein
MLADGEINGYREKLEKESRDVVNYFREAIAARLPDSKRPWGTR